MKEFYFIFMILLMVDFVAFMQRLAFWVAMILEGLDRLKKLPYGKTYDRTLKLYKTAKIRTFGWAIICFATFCFYCDCVTHLRW